MPRTELARLLRCIAHDHQVAETLGVAPSDVPAVRGEKPDLTRRSVLRIGAAGVGAAMFGTAPRTARAADQPRIAIVGAGIAGLTAALRLADRGITSTVYEADTRVGGRMFSNPAGAYWDAAQITEWGGEFIDSDHHLVRSLAARFGIALDDVRSAAPGGATEAYYFSGDYYTYRQASIDFAPVHRALRNDQAKFSWPVAWNTDNSPHAIALSNMSIHDWIDTRVPGGHSSRFGRLLDTAYTTEFGLDTRLSSALGIIGMLGSQPSTGRFALYGTSDARYHLRGGNQQLPVAMQAALPADTVHFGRRLVALSVSSTGEQELTFSVDGATRAITADHTVLALPLGVLKEIDFSCAGFDTRKHGSIDTMLMGQNCKLALQFTTRLWNTRGLWGISSGSTMSDTGYQTSWESTRDQPGEQGILVDYAGGSHAADFTPDVPFCTATDPQVVAYAQSSLKQFETVFPGLTDRWNGKATLAAWPRHPYTNGAYSTWPVGYAHHYAGYEGVRQGKVHFAGEHISLDYQGYMEGAAESGRRAADEILADLSIS
ncbi:NAD(P)/FAD-dependent oxidoreductase [Saccharopolyspora rosea]|uniref:FAD-dependent oxidoreductase n=1 Tax=Saccharopolyspora rosea TaxID=524884 RepID=A0ABW3FQW8_9PSEU